MTNKTKLQVAWDVIFAALNIELIGCYVIYDCDEKLINVVQFIPTENGGIEIMDVDDETECNDLLVKLLNEQYTIAELPF